MFQLREVVEDTILLDKGTNKKTFIIDTLVSMAEQTNLLAFNTALEASEAGEQNKELAIISEKLRRLSEQSAKTADEIMELILDSQQKRSSINEKLAHKV